MPSNYPVPGNQCLALTDVDPIKPINHTHSSTSPSLRYCYPVLCFGPGPKLEGIWMFPSQVLPIYQRILPLPISCATRLDTTPRDLGIRHSDTALHRLTRQIESLRLATVLPRPWPFPLPLPLPPAPGRTRVVGDLLVFEHCLMPAGLSARQYYPDI